MDVHRRRRPQRLLRHQGHDVPRAWYHSQYDTTDLIDWSYLAKNAKLYGLLQQGLDGGVLPYHFRARATQFVDNFDATR